MNQSLQSSVEGTVALWAWSSALAVALGLALAAGSLSPRLAVRAASRVAVNLTRGIPTSLLVVGCGIAMLRLSSAAALPLVFPGTLDAFQQLAWAIVVALALGSAGHLAEIFRAARLAIGPARLEQTRLLGLSRSRRTALVAREAAVVALPPTGTRLVHQLHNTAFAALFPVTEMFGFVEVRANATFRVLDYVLLGCVVYVTLSALIWLGVRGLEAALVRQFTAVPRTSVATA